MKAKGSTAYRKRAQESIGRRISVKGNRGLGHHQVWVFKFTGE